MMHNYMLQDNSMSNRDDWEFVYNSYTLEFPKGYYLYKPTGEKFCFCQGIQDKVGKANEDYIYNKWWFDNS